MNEYANEIKEKLDSLLVEMDENSYLFTKHPGKDFTRKRKFDFKEMLRILLSMGGNSLKLLNMPLRHALLRRSCLSAQTIHESLFTGYIFLLSMLKLS